MAIEAGRVLSQRYRLIRPVGQGSQASVWVAEHLALQTHVAVKLIDPELAKKESARERFRREATAAAQLRSAHVVQILDHGIDGDQPFIVMELLDGEDLFERLAHRLRVSLRETSKIVTQVARALSRAHAAGIVHRDLKPENVFLCPNEDDEVVKVLDFGVAKVKDAARVTMQKTNVGTLIGTPHYMSPEQVKGIGEIDFRTDLWALGVIAFQCVTGEMPFDSEGVGDLLIKISMGTIPVPSKVYPGAPAPFDAWFAKACDRDPGKRFQSAREMALALAAVVNQIDGVVPRAPTVRPPQATLPGMPKSVPPAPRMPGGLVQPEEHVDSVDLEELEPFDEDDDDDRPTRMRAAAVTMGPRAAPNPGPAEPAQGTMGPRAAGAKPRHASDAPGAALSPPRPSAGAAGAAAKTPARPNTAVGIAPPPRASVPKMAAVTPPSPAAATPPRATPPVRPDVAARASVAMGPQAAPNPGALRAPVVAEPAEPADPAPEPAAAAPVVVGTRESSHEIVDFDETIPATEAMEAGLAHAGFPLVVRANAPPPSANAAALAPLSEPPRAPSPLPPQPSRGAPADEPRAVIAPVIVNPPRAIPPSPPAQDAFTPQPAFAPQPASAPQPPRPAPPSPPSAPVRAAPAVPATPAPVELEASHRFESTLMVPPPELDGSSKRKRLVRYMVAGLVLFAVGITWTVVRSQLDGGSGPAGTPTDMPSTTAEPPPTAPTTTTTTTVTATAVDPGKVTRPGKPAPTFRGPSTAKPNRPRKMPQPDDGTIVVPHPDDGVPPAP